MCIDIETIQNLVISDELKILSYKYNMFRDIPDNFRGN